MELQANKDNFLSAGAHQVRAHELSRAVRAADTINGHPLVDWNLSRSEKDLNALEKALMRRFTSSSHTVVLLLILPSTQHHPPMRCRQFDRNEGRRSSGEGPDGFWQ